MTTPSLESRVLDSLARVLPRVDPEQIDPAINFRDQLELDSIDYLRFVLDLEQHLAVRIPQADYPRLSSLQGCIDYLPHLMEKADT